MNTIELCKKVKSEHQYQKFIVGTDNKITIVDDDCNFADTLDAQSANVVCLVHENLSEPNKTKYGNMNIFVAIDFAWKAVKK